MGRGFSKDIETNRIGWIIIGIFVICLAVLTLIHYVFPLQNRLGILTNGTSYDLELNNSYATQSATNGCIYGVLVDNVSVSRSQWGIYISNYNEGDWLRSSYVSICGK